MTQKSLSVRLVMIGLWFITIALFLFLPALFQLIQGQRTLNVLVFPTMVDIQQLHAFEKETGIKIYMSYYESNEELLRKVRATQGKGYDLLIVTDNNVEKLAQENLLKRIDKTAVSFFEHLKPELRGHYFDPTNEYSIPYYLGVYGIGYNKDYFPYAQQPIISWNLIFERQPFMITMTDDPRRAILLAGFYLFGSINNLTTPDKIAGIEQKLIQQKKWVDLYSDFRGEEVLASRSCPVAVTISSDLWRIQQEYTNLKFAIPAEGSFMIIDSFVIPSATNKQALAYQLLNYIYKPEILKYHCLKYGFCPPTDQVEVQNYDLFCPKKDELQKLDFFRNVIPKHLVDKIWVAVMAR